MNYSCFKWAANLENKRISFPVANDTDLYAYISAIETQ